MPSFGHRLNSTFIKLQIQVMYECYTGMHIYTYLCSRWLYCLLRGGDRDSKPGSLHPGLCGWSLFCCGVPGSCSVGCRAMPHSEAVHGTSLVNVSPVEKQMDAWVSLENFCVLKHKEHESKGEMQCFHFCMGEEQLHVLPTWSPNGLHIISGC